MGGQDDLRSRVDRLDLTLFEIDAQLSPDDRRSLLALHSVCAQAHGSFSYLEIGSHIGGSLQTFVRDPACSAVVSIDPRPKSQPDERGPSFDYPGNSTERMLEHLRRLPDSDPAKIVTIERSTEDIDVGELTSRPQLAFIDGEHTDAAALRDARFCLAAMRGEGCIVFHDSTIVHGGISRFVDECEGRGLRFAAAALPSRMFAVEIGEQRLFSLEPLAGQVRQSYRAYLLALAEFEPYRADFRRFSRRALRGLEYGARTLLRRPRGRRQEHV